MGLCSSCSIRICCKSWDNASTSLERFFSVWLKLSSTGWSWLIIVDIKLMHRQQNGWIKERQRLRGRDPFSGTWNIDNKPVKTYRDYTFQILISENYGSAQTHEISTHHGTKSQHSEWKQAQHSNISTTNGNQPSTTTKLAQHNGNKPHNNKISATQRDKLQHISPMHGVVTISLCFGDFFVAHILGHRRKQWIYQHSDSSHRYRNSLNHWAHADSLPARAGSP